MALQRGVHVAVELKYLCRVLAKQRRGKDLGAGSGALGVSRQVDWAKGTDLAVTGDTLVGLDPHDGAVEHLHGFAVGPVVAALVKR